MPDPSGIRVMVTGAIQSGKSTVVRAVMAQLGWSEPAGFFTHWGGVERPAPEIFIEPWTGGAQGMARQLPGRTGSDGVPYALDADTFTRVACRSLAVPAGPVVVDELGVLELEADAFTAALAAVLRGPAPVLLVIQERALSRWQSRLDPDAVLPVFRVTPASRDALPAEIAALFRA